MKFYKGQEVVCIAEKNEWDPVLSDFNRSLQMALGNEILPLKNKTYVVTNPFSLHYEGTNYIEINGFGGTPISEKAFKPLVEACVNYSIEEISLVKLN